MIPTGGDIGLHEHFPGSEQVCMCVGIEARCLHHELHHLCGDAIAREELVGGLGGTSFEGWIGVGIVSVDITAVDEAANENNSAVCQGLSGGIPTLLLHLNEGRVIEPLAIRGGQVIAVGTRIEDSDGFGAIVVHVDVVVRARASLVPLRTNVASWTDGAIATKCSIGAVREMHAGGTEDIGCYIHGLRSVSGNVPRDRGVIQKVEEFKLSIQTILHPKPDDH